MKISIRKHVYFWLGFLTWDITQSFISMFNAGESVSSDSIKAIVIAGILFIAVRMVLAYFLYFFVFKPYIEGTSNKSLLILYGIAALLVVLFVQRAITFYYVYPEMFRVNMTGRRYFNTSAFFIVMFDLLVPIFLLFLLELYDYFKSTREKATILEKERLKSELKFLKTQINPHFLFNVLGTIHAFTRKESPKAANVTLKLSEILRFVIYKAAGREISIKDEIKLLEDYLELEQTRFENKLQVRFDISMDDEEKKMAPMLLLPFLENAVKHGVSESRFQSYINISLKVNGQKLVFVIQNSFEERQYGYVQEGIGLVNVKRRLELLYPTHHLELKKTEGNYTAALTLNLSENEKIVMPYH